MTLQKSGKNVRFISITPVISEVTMNNIKQSDPEYVLIVFRTSGKHHYPEKEMDIFTADPQAYLDKFVSTDEGDRIWHAVMLGPQTRRDYANRAAEYKSPELLECEARRYERLGEKKLEDFRSMGIYRDS